MALTPEELAKLTDEELAAEMIRVSDGVQDATEVVREWMHRKPAERPPNGAYHITSTVP